MKDWVPNGWLCLGCANRKPREGAHCQVCGSITEARPLAYPASLPLEFMPVFTPSPPRTRRRK